MKNRFNFQKIIARYWWIILTIIVLGITLFQLYKPCNECEQKVLLKTDSLMGEWFTPHAAMRKVIFSENGKFIFSEWEDASLTGNYEVQGGSVVLLFDDLDKGELRLEYRKDDGPALENKGQGEYFVKSD